MKSKELKIYNLPANRTVLSSINAKPMGLLITLTALSVIAAFVEETKILGFGLAFVFLAFIAFLPPRVLIEFSEEYMVLYNRADHNDCFLVYYEDVTSWNYTRGVTYDELSISLADGTSTHIEGFSRSLYESSLNQHMADKKEKTGKK